MRQGASPMLDHWLDGVYPSLRYEAAEAARDVRLHDHVRALNSSMVFAFNLFLPFREHPLVLGPPLDDIVWEPPTLEWTPPGGLLCEIDGEVPRDDEHATAVDALLQGRRSDGRRVAVLVEVKLTEGGFSRCNGATSRNNRDKSVCGDGLAMLAAPRRCYLTHPLHQTRPRRYWPIFEAAHGSLPAAYPGVASGPCPFRGAGQQLMRQHALALALEQEGLADEAWVLLVHHDDNPDVLPRFEAYLRILTGASRFMSLPASSLLCAGPQPWADWMRTRYLLETR